VPQRVLRRSCLAPATVLGPCDRLPLRRLASARALSLGSGVMGGGSLLDDRGVRSGDARRSHLERERPAPATRDGSGRAPAAERGSLAYNRKKYKKHGGA
jgi:hypothetical protein